MDPADTVADVNVGDELISINGVKMRDATKEAVLAALHGAPGEVRKLVQ